jgi:hypothetical protein
MHEIISPQIIRNLVSLPQKGFPAKLLAFRGANISRAGPCLALLVPSFETPVERFQYLIMLSTFTHAVFTLPFSLHEQYYIKITIQ